MKVNLNSEDYTLDEGSSLALLLEAAGLLEEIGIAIAVNKKVVPRESWNNEILNDGDEVLIIKASQGG